MDHMGTPENFYRFAIERDERMFETVREALKKHPGYAVLVVGGFHGESLARKFAQGGLPYSLVSPAFREIDTDLNEKYMRAMGRLPEGEKLNRWVHSLLEKLSPSIYSVRPEAGEVIASLSRRFTRGNTIRPGKNIFRSRPLRRPRLLSRALGAFVLGLSFAVFSPARAQDLNVPEWLSFRELTPKIEKVLKSFEQAENPKERARLAKALAEIVARANNAKVKKIIIDDLGERVEKNADRKIESIKSSNFYWDLIPALIASVFVALGAWGWTRFFVRERTIQESIEFDNSPFVVQPGEVLQLFTEKGVEILIDGDEVIVGNTTYTLEKGVNIFDREGVSERNSEYTGEVTVFEVQEDTTDAERLFIIDNDRGKIEVQVSSVAKSWQAALGRSENSGSLFPSTSFMTAVIFIIALVGLPMMKYALPRKPTHPFSTADLLAVIRQVDVSEELLPESELESESESTPEPAIQSPAAESETPQEAAAPAPPADFLPPQTEPEHPVLEELPEPEPTIPIIPLPFAAEARVSKNVQPIIAENSGILRILDGGEFAILPEDLIDQERDILAQIEEQKKRIDEAIKSWETDRKFADADLRVREKSNLQEVLERELAKLEEEAAKISARVADFAVTPGDPPGHSYEVTFSAADEAYITSGQTIGACDADWTRILK
ncbi:MAG: hypothetical protein HY586_01420, partial [Candidatus Omnitrophica bacterium]|nr:hypothetical protein [Candidatus Omnitrophota bacterium]